MTAASYPPGVIGIPSTPMIWTAAAMAVLSVPSRAPAGTQTIVMGQAHSSSIAHNRNEIVKRFLAAEHAQWLLFLDSDMVPPVDVVPRLLAHGDDFDVISGACFMRLPPHLPAWNVLDSLAPGAGDRGVSEVESVGMGCALVQRRVLEGMPFPWFEHPEPGVGEDIVFCHKTRAHGFRVWLDPMLDVGHHAPLVVNRELAEAWHTTATGRAQLKDAERRAAQYFEERAR